MVIMLVFMGIFGSHQLWQIIGFVLHMPYLQSFGITISSYGHINYGCNYRRRGTLYLQD